MFIMFGMIGMYCMFRMHVIRTIYWCTRHIFEVRSGLYFPPIKTQTRGACLRESIVQSF